MKKEEKYYDSPSDFEPSASTKKYWRKTRKMKRKFGNIWFPGLFNTTGYETDKKMFLIIFILELLGFYFLAASVNWSFEIFWAFLIAILFDFACVFWAHAKSGAINENNNYIIVANYDREWNKVKRIKWDNTKLKLITVYPADIFIALIAILKIWFYIEAKGGMQFIINSDNGTYDIKVIGVIIIYILICVLHIVYSGYAIHGYLFKRKINSEYKSFLAQEHSHKVNNLPSTSRFSENQINNYRHYTIPNHLLRAHDATELKTIASGERSHYLSKHSDNGYIIHTWSVLEDSDLYSIAQEGQISTPEKEIVAICGLKHQLDLMVSSPKFIIPQS